MNRTSKIRNIGRLVAAGAMSLLLGGCGGGGAGGSGSLSLSTDKLGFVATSTVSPVAAQRLTANINGASGTIYIRIEYGGAAIESVSGVTISSETSGYVTVQPANSSLLGAGVHTGLITVYACTSNPECTSDQLKGSPQTAEVEYDITGVTADDPHADFTVQSIVEPDDLVREVAIDNYPDANWSPAESIPWLTATRDSDASPTQSRLVVTLVPEAVAAMDNGVYTGTITLFPANGIVETVDVSLSIGRTIANSVAPYIEVADTSAESIIRGENLDDLVLTDVRFGPVAATSFRVVSSTEVRATHPALPEGTYPVTLVDPSGLVTSMASLSVAAPALYPADTIEYPPTLLLNYQVRGLVYDAGRKALLAALLLNDGSGMSSILRYVHNGVSWVIDKEVAVEGSIAALALSNDGKRLLAASGAASIQQLDPLSLDVLSTATQSNPGFIIQTLSITNDGFVLSPLTTNTASGFHAGIKYSIAKSEFIDFQQAGYDFYTGDSVASLDGSIVLLCSTTGTTSSSFCTRYEAGSGILTRIGVSADSYGPASDRTGSRFVIGRQFISDQNLLPLASLPEQMRAVVLSPDGSRVYAVDLAFKFRTFSLTPVAGTVLIEELGSPQDLNAYPGVVLSRMILSSDGRTVFIGGSGRAVVQPVGN